MSFRAVYISHYVHASAPAPGGLFGSTAAPAPATGGLFGSTPAAAPAAGGLFGAAPASAPGGLFGSTPAPAPGGLFGAPPAPAPAGGLFGSTPAPAPGGLFGAPAPAPGGGLFGAPAPAPGGLFGAPAPKPAGGGLFGAPVPAPGGYFGAPAPAPQTGGLFGAPVHAPTAPLGGAYPMTMPLAAAMPPPTADAVLAQQLAAVERAKKELETLDAWRGGTPSGSGVIPASLTEWDAAAQASSYGYGTSSGPVSSYAASSTALMVYNGAPRTSASIRPRGFGPVKSSTLTSAEGLMSRGRAPGSPLLSPDSYLSSSSKRLVIKPGSLTPKPKMRLQLTNGDSSEGKCQGTNGHEAQIPDNMTNRTSESPSSVSATPTPAVVEDHAAGVGIATPTSPGYASPEAAPNTNGGGSPVATTSVVTTDIVAIETEGVEQTPQSSAKKPVSPGGGIAYDFYRRVIGGADMLSPQMNGGKQSHKLYLPTLTKDGYTVSPSLDSLSEMSEADLAAVSGFSVERAGFGSIAWDGSVDIRGVDLDAIICIESKDVAVYDSEESKGTKPPVGSKLNRPAVITMHGVYPVNGPDSSPEITNKFERKIRKNTKKMGADLISYDVACGMWKFRVKHFSRYGLLEDNDDEEEMEGSDRIVVTSHRASWDFDEGGCGGQSPVKESGQVYEKRRKSRLQAPSGGDEEMSETTDDESIALTIEGDVFNKESESGVIEAADNAYAMMLETAMMTPVARGSTEDFSMVDDEGAGEQNKGFLFNEREEGSSYVVDRPIPPQMENMVATKKRGFCSESAKKCGIDSMTRSSSDFGMRMGRSFRVGWRPDGSFIFPGQLSPKPNRPQIYQGVQLVQRRPVLDHDAVMPQKDMRSRTALLETHLKHSVKIDTDEIGCPSFALPKSLNYKDGTVSSYRSLCQALDDFSKATQDIPSSCDPEMSNLSSRTFLLLSLLFGLEDSMSVSISKMPSIDSILSDDCRREGLMQWFRQAVAHDTQEEISLALDRHDSPAAIFAALSGCDMARASSLSTELGYLRLATLLSSSGQQIQAELRRQMALWHDSGAIASVPPGFARVYSLLSGDEEVEENIYKSNPCSTGFDWRRRLAVRLCFGSRVNSLSQVIQDFESNFKAGVSPPPSPRYVTHLNGTCEEGAHCILYNLLQLGVVGNNEAADYSRLSLSSIVSPLTHTSCVHDFSTAFHLASTISALGCTEELTIMEEARLIDGYVTQLILEGLWEWAIYICLCACNRFSSRNGIDCLWQRRAFDILSRNITRIVDRRSFLQSKIMLPSNWFDRALALHSTYLHDFMGEANYTTQFSPAKAMGIYEELCLPSILFKGGAEVIMRNMKSLKNGNASEEGILFGFLQLCEEVLKLSQLSQKEQLAQRDRMEGLILLCDHLRAKAEEIETLSEDSFWVSDIPRPVCVAELVSCLSTLETQLLALQQGLSIFEDTRSQGIRRLKLSSQLTYNISHPDTVFEMHGREESLGEQDNQRGFFGTSL